MKEVYIMRPACMYCREFRYYDANTGRCKHFGRTVKVKYSCLHFVSKVNQEGGWYENYLGRRVNS